MESDSTQITGSPSGLKAPRPGDVVCERYEIRDVVESDALVVTYRAIDQESDEPVLVRVSAPGLLGEKEARRVAERLRPLVGASGRADGGTAWPALLDVERDGAFVGTVEPWPRGTSFRSVLEARRVKRQRFAPGELLPLVARLAAALEDLPDEGALAGLHHGDLRPHRVYVHPDGISITGGFLLAALPGDAVAEVLTRDLVLRRTLAPEVADGLAGRAADRHAVAALAWEALEGDAPPPSAQPGDCTAEPALGAILVRYLDPDPAARPPSLRGLVDALAARAGLPVPPGKDRLVLRSDTSITQEIAETTETGSYKLADGEILAVDTRPEQRGREPAAAKPRGGGGDLDPDLVRAAKANAAVSETGTFQLDGDELVPLSAKLVAEPAAGRGPVGPAKKSGPAQPAPSRTSDPGPAAPAKPSAPGQPVATHAAGAPAAKTAAPGQPAPSKTSAPRQPAPAAPAPAAPAPTGSARASGPKLAARAPNAQPLTPEAPSAGPTRGASPRAKAVGEAPRPRAPADRTQELGEQDLVALPAAARARPKWEHSALPPTGAPLPALRPSPTPAAPAGGPPSSAAHPQPTRPGELPASPAEPVVAEPSSGSGMILIVSAVVLAVVILGAAFWYRAYEEQVRHEQEIEQRLRDLRH